MRRNHVASVSGANCPEVKNWRVLWEFSSGPLIGKTHLLTTAWFCCLKSQAAAAWESSLHVYMYAQIQKWYRSAPMLKLQRWGKNQASVHCVFPWIRVKSSSRAQLNPALHVDRNLHPLLDFLPFSWGCCAATADHKTQRWASQGTVRFTKEIFTGWRHILVYFCSLCSRSLVTSAERDLGSWCFSYSITCTTGVLFPSPNIHGCVFLSVIFCLSLFSQCFLCDSHQSLTYNSCYANDTSPMNQELLPSHWQSCNHCSIVI